MSYSGLTGVSRLKNQLLSYLDPRVKPEDDKERG